MINVGYLTAGRDADSDEIYTPFYAVDPILKYIPTDKVVWCPFDTERSAFVRSFKEHGYEVMYSHLATGQNFFTYEPDRPYDIIVSNPPFSKKDGVLRRLYELGRPFAIILPLNSLQGVQRYHYFRQGIQLLTFDKRIDYHTRGDYSSYCRGSAFASAYFCRNVLPQDLILEEIEKYERSLM